MTGETDGPAGFETHIKPLFRERDQTGNGPRSTSGPTTTSANTPMPSSRLREGTMPCDGSWPPAEVDRFQQSVESGKPA